MHIGIDGGLSGAVAVLAADGALVTLHDTLTLILKVARGTRQTYDCPSLVALLQPYAGLGPCTTRWRRLVYRHRGARMVVCTLRNILTTRGISQRELARRSGVHRATIARLCRDDWWTLDRLVVERLCACLHIKPRALLVWKDYDDEEDDLA